MNITRLENIETWLANRKNFMSFRKEGDLFQGLQT
jgi:hypothetical protein